MKLKDKRGITTVDAVISIFILAFFITINISLGYNSFVKAKTIERNEMATYYAVKIAEYVQNLPYNEVTSNLNLSELNLSNNYGYSVNVQQPTYKNIENPKDLIKIVTITVSYSVGKENKEYEIKTLKI